MKTGGKFFALSIALLISILLGAFSIFALGEYGWLVFLLVPFLLGALPTFIYGQHHPLTRNEATALGFYALGGACLALLLFAAEGLICIAMASPILLLLNWLGTLAAFYTLQDKNVSNRDATLLVLLLSFSFMSFDYLDKGEKLISVSTSIEVLAPIENVWENVVTFDALDEPDALLFKTGISYPTHATIEGQGVGAMRYCNFTTGPFVEPITSWDEPNLLAFDVIEQPIPMTEYNPFWDIHPPHLDGYFSSVKGQFKLTEIAQNKTLLEGTTWYKLKIHPIFYWKGWTDYILHEIHLLVLEHIKVEAEKY